MRRVLVVDDEENIRLVLRTLLRKHGYQVETAESAEDALAQLESFDPDFVLADVRMNGMTGLELSSELRARSSSATVILMSAYGSVDLAIEAMKAGAYDYISKPFKQDEVLLALAKAEERESLRRENRALKRAMREERTFHGILGKSEAIEKVFATIEKVADYKTTVLIQGESGTGKELVADALHARSVYADGELVAVNCGAIPEELFESELFGYVEGAFTSSRRGGRRGLFEQAHRGVIFLDEIGEMPLSQQAKLLRVLEERRVRPLGTNRELNLDLKVVAATNCDLRERVHAGRFREDLFYRLNVFYLYLPPLRERPSDIPEIARYLLREYAARYGQSLDDAAVWEMLAPRFSAYAWGGNVRELENFVERIVVSLARFDSIEALRSALPRVLPELFEPCRDRGSGGTLRERELDSIREALARFDQDKTRAAEYLGISQTTLWRRLKHMGGDAGN